MDVMRISRDSYLSRLDVAVGGGSENSPWAGHAPIPGVAFADASGYDCYDRGRSGARAEQCAEVTASEVPRGGSFRFRKNPVSWFVSDFNGNEFPLVLPFHLDLGVPTDLSRRGVHEIGVDGVEHAPFSVGSAGAATHTLLAAVASNEKSSNGPSLCRKESPFRQIALCPLVRDRSRVPLGPLFDSTYPRPPSAFSHPRCSRR